MKKMMVLLACLVFSISAMAADLEQIKATSNSDMIAQLTSMDAEAWADYLNTVLENGDDALIKRVLTNAQRALNSMDDEAARTVAAKINEDVPMVILARRITGKYTLAYAPSKTDDSMTVNLKIQEISKGTGTISSKGSRN